MTTVPAIPKNTKVLLLGLELRLDLLLLREALAIMFYTFFLAGAGVLTIIGVLFRGPGWNWTYPWIDGIWFDDLLDWIHFE